MRIKFYGVFIWAKLLGCLIFFGSGSLAQASDLGSDLAWDARAGFNGRTYPIGAQVVGTLGVAYPIWGKWREPLPNGKVNWQHGYVRLVANGATSVVVNRMGFEFQFFPVSILGFSVGQDWGVRNFVPKVVNCEGITCDGFVTRRYLRWISVGAVGKFVWNIAGRYEELRAPEASQPRFWDEMTLVTGASSGERVLTWLPVVLYQLNDRWQAGGAALYSHAIDTGGDSLMYGPVVGYRTGPDFTAIVGLGPIHSPQAKAGFTGFFTLQWMLKGGISIMDQAASGSPNSASKSELE